MKKQIATIGILGLLACVIGPEPRLLYMWITVGGVALYCYSVVESAYPRR